MSVGVYLPSEIISEEVLEWKEATLKGVLDGNGLPLVRCSSSRPSSLENDRFTSQQPESRRFADWLEQSNELQAIRGT